MSQFAHHQVDADRVARLQRQDDVEDGQRSRSGFGLGYGVVLQSFRLVASRVHTRHAVVGFGQDRLDLLVPVTREDGAEEIVSVDGGGENT